MATATRSLCRTLFQVSRQVPLKRKRQQSWRIPIPHPQARPFSSSPWRAGSENPDPPPGAGSVQSKQPEQTEEDEDVDSQDSVASYVDYGTLDTSELLTPSIPISVNDLDPEARADYEVLPKDQQENYMALENHYKALAESPGLDIEFRQLARQVAREVDKQENINFPNIKLKRAETGFWAEDEDDEFGQVEDDDDEWSEEAITSVAESELELHREMRDYTRIAAWDMPLLTKFAKPFEPPPLTSPLRFRYTTYMGEGHPAAKKVVVQFCTRDLPGFSEAQRIKLMKLAGVRYNPDTDVVKMSCEKFEAPAQNKRYLGDLIGKLIAEARDPKEMFEDVPLDFRHHTPKRTPMFPDDWKMTPERVQKLLEQRKQQALLGKGQPVVNGKAILEAHATVNAVRQLA